MTDCKRSRHVVAVFSLVFMLVILFFTGHAPAAEGPWQLVKIRMTPQRGIARWETKIGTTPVAYELKINESSVDVRARKTIGGKNYNFGYQINFFTPPRTLTLRQKLDFPIRVQSTIPNKQYDGPAIITKLTSTELSIQSGHALNQLTSMHLHHREVNRSDLKATITVGPWIKSETIEFTMSFMGGGFDKSARASITWVYGRQIAERPTSPPVPSNAKEHIPSRVLPSQGAPPISQTREYAAFQGLFDPAISKAEWDRLLNRRINELVGVARSYPGVHNFLEVPNEQHRWLIETYRLKGYAFREYFNKPGPKRETELFWHLWLGGDPGKQALEGSEKYPYAAVTSSTMWDLHQRILSSQGWQLEPADVMRLSLDVTRGNYPLAVLTAHNLLKTITERGRSVIIDANKMRQQNQWLYDKKFDSFRRDLGEYGPFVKRLASLRRDPNRVRDKMGPWYHLFAVLTAAGVASPSSANVAAYGEHLMKAASFFENEAGFNREKATIDTRFAVAAAGELAELSRNYLYSDVLQRFYISKPYGWQMHEVNASQGVVFTSPTPPGSRTPLTITFLMSSDPDPPRFFEALFGNLQRQTPSLRIAAQGNRKLDLLDARWRKYVGPKHQAYFVYTSRPYRDPRIGQRMEVILVSVVGENEAFRAYERWAAGLLRTIRIRE